MENEIKPQLDYQSPNRPNTKDFSVGLGVLFLIAAVLFGAWVYTADIAEPRLDQDQSEGQPEMGVAADVLEEKVLPAEGATLPVRWGDLGVKMLNAGVIDEEKFQSLYAARGGITEETRQLLYGEANGNIRITSENAGVILNLLWALGLGNKNDILESGPMVDPRLTGGQARYGGAERFASTGGWTLAQGDAMDHYSQHPFIVLTPAQQEIVERVAKNIYRPCCNNSTYFPDCNHGMAMLGLLELMASQGVSEKEMYGAALRVNAYWFPDTYLTIATYLESKGTEWDKADPKELLGYNFSSAAGYRQILSQVAPPESRASGGCGV